MNAQRAQGYCTGCVAAAAAARQHDWWAGVFCTAWQLPLLPCRLLLLLLLQLLLL
jgi:hypothetical protein